ncbi:MAG: ABC transporter substrate-binding protein [Acidimicrobiales bacterium]|nr:ABC transporter substrate-binding protein [Acidimicrobiales bacterium]RZV43658.1 MAG: ABC transporter substrate-binding protein [Acidimicrobiales bacterium]
MKRMRMLAALFALLALVATACSASDDDETSTGDTSSETSDDSSSDDSSSDDTAEDDAMEDDTAEDDAMEDDTAEDDAMEDDAMEDELATDFGVTEDSIRVGLSADLSGPFAALTSVIVDAQEAYFDRVNENGGIAGREVELVVLDNAYDVPTQQDNYAELSEESEEGVVLISQSTGSPHTSAIANSLVEDDLFAIPLSWYSGWADQDFGGNVFELYTNYCFEGMNGVEFLVGQSGKAAPTLAVVTRPGEYGQDGAAGAKIAAEALGLEIVYDGEGVVEGDDFTPIITELVSAQPDLVWITTSPTQTAQIVGGAFQGGLTGAIWSGSSPSYNPALLDTPVGPILDAAYFHSTYAALWGANDSAGMQDMMAEITARIPTGTYAQADTYVIGWTEAMMAEAVLEAAAASGDMTRAGVLDAARNVSVDFQGLAPDQTWLGDPNDFAVRESYIYDVVLADATTTTPITEPGSGGLALLEGPYVGDVAAGYDFQEPCFVSEG